MKVGRLIEILEEIDPSLKVNVCITHTECGEEHTHIRNLEWVEITQHSTTQLDGASQVYLHSPTRVYPSTT